MSESALDVKHHTALGMVDQCRMSGGSSTHARHPTSDINACLTGPSRMVMSGRTLDINRTSTLIMGDMKRSRQTRGRGMHACIPDSNDEGRIRPESMRGIPLGGGRHGDAPMTELEHPLDLMPVKHMPVRLTGLECLKARSWVRLMTVLASVSGSPPRPAGSPTSARRPSLRTSAGMSSAVMESQARSNER
jgi:hypothetical protein